MVANANGSLVIITNGNYFARLILSGVFQHYSGNISGVVIITGDYKARTGVRALWQLSRVTAFPYIIYKLITFVAFGLAQRIYRNAAFGVEQQARAQGIPIHEAVSIKSPEVLDWVASLKPDLLVSVSCPQMIGRKLLETARLGGINIHSSLLPSYAGLAPYYWVLSTGEQETGTSVHYMTLRFDEGNILAQKRITIEPDESAFHLFKRLALVGNEAILEALPLALAGNSGLKQDLTRYSYFSNPTFKSYQSLKHFGHALIRIGELLTTIQEEANHGRS